ncbi:hypothetical protein WJX84_005272 [Apatococcus fuscideae]|uniref:RNA helicase n=1 Tax=Apatococcus fuscideae TaxID=2026836 RepID=A0AAW1S9U9_9CHLO
MLDESIIDYELIEAVIDHIDAQHGPGAILVFLPGIAEISKVLDRLTATSNKNSRRWVIPLHSSVSAAEQRQAFNRPPQGVRKVVLATNIAETSLTIADVCFVIDAGRLKERRHDASRGMGLLIEDWVSRASALQRKGRAGRVQEGMCFSLFTRQRFEHQMRKFQAPEMVRVPLEELVLQIHLLRLGKAYAFLQRVLEPPPAKSVEGALAQLQSVGALSKEEVLTPLGHHLAQLPVDARMGKLLVVAALLGCLAPALTVAACLSYKSPFSAPVGQQDQARRAMQGLATAGTSSLASGQQSDHLLMVAAYEGWQAAKKQGRNAQRSFAQRHFLSEQTLEMISDMRNQFGSMLADTRLLARPAKGFERSGSWIDDHSEIWNLYAKHVAVVKAALCSALYPNIAVMEDGPDGNKRPAWNDGYSEVAVHPSSINHMLSANQYQRPYQIYLEKVRTSKVFMRDCTVIAPMTLLLFGGSLDILHQSGYVQIDGWLRIKAAAPLAVLVKQLRQALESVLEKTIATTSETSESADHSILQQVATLLDDEERQLTL